MAVDIVNLTPVVIRVYAQGARPVIPDAPLVNRDEKFLVTGVKLDLTRMRPVLICEQVIFDPNVIVALIVDERWEAGAVIIATPVIDERWELSLDGSEAFHDERWEVDFSAPTDQFFSEGWES